MANLTKTKTWQYLVGQRSTQATANDLYASLLLNLKNLLKSGTLTVPAVVLSSSNSVTSSAADNWNSITDLVWAGLGSPRSWAVLKFPGMAGGNYQVCFLCGNTSTRSSASIIISPSAGFTGGSTTVRPTATDEVTILSTNSWCITGFTGFTALIQLLQTSDGKNIRAVIHHNGAPVSLFFLETVANAEAWWTVPVIAGWRGNTSVIDYSTWYGAANAYSYAGGSFTCYLGSMSWGGTASPAGNRLQIANSRTSKYVASEIGVASETASPATVGFHGKLPDVWWGPTAGVTEGQTAPNDGTYQYVQFGQWIIPWNGTLPVVA